MVERDLPDDPEALKTLVVQLFADKTRLQHQLEVLRRRLFGRKSETIDPAQLAMFIASPTEEGSSSLSTGPSPATEKPRTRASGHGRAVLPSHLPRQRIEYTPTASQLVCSCGREMRRFAEESTETLEYVPASFVVVEHVRPKFSCPKCHDAVAIAPPPSLPIDKGRPGVGLLAHVLVSKYADHLPLHRLEGIFARQGVDLSRSTMCDWVAGAADLLSPIVDEMKRQVVLAPIVQSDDTGIPVLCDERKRTKRGVMWVYQGAGHAIFEYTPTRSATGPKRFLDGYRGYLQADAYSGYDQVYASGAIVEVGCWAHTRRYFFEAQESDPRRCAQMLKWIAMLYAIERDATDAQLDVVGRVALRRDRAGPILAQMRLWLDEVAQFVLPRSPLGAAVGYARNQWHALTRYLDDGRLGLDNNAAERSLRAIAIGRKNWMFAGSDDGARRAAIMYSLIVSCRLRGIDPFAYLRAVLDAVGCHPASRVDELTPRAWRARLTDAG